MEKIKANVVSTDRIFFAEIIFDEKIVSINELQTVPHPDYDFAMPGFIDLHLHGGGGVDVMDFKSNHPTSYDLSPLLKTHAAKGTTSLLLTTVTAPYQFLENVFQKIEEKKHNQQASESRIVGIHLEGPFISKDKLGAQPDYVRRFSIDEILKLHQISQIKTITVAPEQLNFSDAQYLLNEGIFIQLGHSNCSYETAIQAARHGKAGYTHLYNAMSGFHHRNPGMVGAALAEAQFAEIIPDLEHVHYGAIKAALNCIKGTYFVTDATSATGMPDGEYTLGDHRVYKCQNGVRLLDGTLAGSAITLYDGLQKLHRSPLKMSMVEYSKRFSTIQSQVIKKDHVIGKLHPNFDADFILCNQDLNLKAVYIKGQKINSIE